MTRLKGYGNKFHNKKCQYKGMKFDSGHELDRYMILEYMEAQLEISNLQRQVSFEVIPKHGKERAAHYIADFVYTDESGKQVVEDAKGFKTQEYILKRKLMNWVHGIEVKEV